MKLFFSCTKPQNLPQQPTRAAVQPLTPEQIHARLQRGFNDMGIIMPYKRDQSSESVHSARSLRRS
jgi:hypothetical protein